MTGTNFTLRAVGRVASPLRDADSAPKQGHEGAPDAWLHFASEVADALDGLTTGSRIIVLTWLDRADRATLRVHPRGDPSNPQAGVFATRSPHRPNPIGLHPVEVLEVDGLSVRVRGIEALDGTPVVDVKIALA